jgi:hypothetical protein
MKKDFLNKIKGAILTKEEAKTIAGGYGGGYSGSFIGTRCSYHGCVERGAIHSFGCSNDGRVENRYVYYDNARPGLLCYY